jgi:HNH endonuclease
MPRTVVDRCSAVAAHWRALSTGAHKITWPCSRRKQRAEKIDKLAPPERRGRLIAGWPLGAFESDLTSFMGGVEIPLRGRYGQGKVARVDKRFAEAVRAHKWYLSNGYMYAKISGVTVYLHRYIFALADIPISNRIDHVNRDRLDCRLENLRLAPCVRKSPGPDGGPLFTAHSGPRTLIINPHPLEGDDGEHYLSAAELDGSERSLRAYLTERQTQLQLRADETVWLATGRIVKLAIEGLTKTQAACWSSLGEWDVHNTSHTLRPPHVGPKPPRRPTLGGLWHDTSCLPHVVKQYTPERTWDIVLDQISPSMPRRAVRSLLSTLLSAVEVRVRWPRLTALNEDVKIMLANRMGRAGQNGRPAYLACATLAALLEAETKHVYDLLANYRRSLSPA